MFLLYGALWINPVLAKPIVLGQRIEPIHLKTIEGSSIQIDQSLQSVIILHFWASWCAACQKEMPILEEYYQKHQAQGLQIIAVSVDEVKEIELVRKIAKAYTFKIALKQQGDFNTLGRIWRIPATFVIDKNAVLQKNGQEGPPEIDMNTLEKSVTPLL